MWYSRLPVLLLASACVGPWPGTEVDPQDLHVGFVYVGPVGDHGWTKTHDDGRLYMEQELGLTSEYLASVDPADTEAAIDELIANGSDVVFTTSFDYAADTLQSAYNYPDADFFNCSGEVYADNLASYMGRMYQVMYLAGYVAAKQSCTGRLGVVASVPIPEIVRHVNAFTLGAQAVNPDVVVEVQYVNAWFDTEVEPAVTNSLISHGVDVIINQTDTTIPLETANGQTVSCEVDGVAQEVPVWTIGYDNADSCTHAEESCLTSAYYNWGPMYTTMLQELAAGTLDTSVYRWEQMQVTPELSSVSLADMSTLVSGTTRVEVESIIPTLADESGRQLPFVGPLDDNQGEQRVSSGEELDDDALNRMCWYVDGVVTWTEEGDVPAEVDSSCVGDF